MEDLLPPPLIGPEKYYPNFVEISVPVPAIDKSESKSCDSGQARCTRVSVFPVLNPMPLGDWECHYVCPDGIVYPIRAPGGSKYRCPVELPVSEVERLTY
jgi:hypothetical protein